MNKIEKLKAALGEVKKALFSEDDMYPAQPGVPAMPPAKPAYTLADGTPVKIDKLEIGGTVMVNEMPAPAGDHALADGTIVSTDANGIITNIVPAKVEVEEPEAPEAPEFMKPGSPDYMDPKKVKKYLEQFAAIPSDVMGKMLTVLFEDRFAYAIQQKKQEEAIEAYKETFATQAAKIEHLQTVNKQLFSLVEQIAEMPVDQPIPTKGKDNFFTNVDTVGIREDIKALAALI